MLKANIYNKKNSEGKDGTHCEISISGSMSEIIAETAIFVEKVRDAIAKQGIAEEMLFAGAVCGAAMDKPLEKMFPPELFELFGGGFKDIVNMAEDEEDS